MIFIDLENFKEGLWKIDSSKKLDFKKFHFSLLNIVVDRFLLQGFTPELIRTYVYTGEYTDSLISKVKYELSLLKEGSEDFVKVKAFLDNIANRKNSQDKVLRFANYCNLLEIKKTPLHYTPKGAIFGKGIFQKGIDVQLAVDLVSHAYKDNFDVAVICSGDVDLLESLKIVKSLGKKIIVVSHPKLISENMIKESDYFCDLTILKDAELNSLFNIKE